MGKDTAAPSCEPEVTAPLASSEKKSPPLSAAGKQAGKRPRDAGNGKEPRDSKQGRQEGQKSTKSGGSSESAKSARGGDAVKTAPPAKTAPVAPVAAAAPAVAGGGAPIQQQQPGRLYHPFRANFNDHFETSTAALQDILPVVMELRQLTRPSAPDAFTLYDPYYCSGTIVELWASLGVSRVLHENRDFYDDIKKKTVPGPYDMLVTNPPFSDDHIPRMMNFLVNGQDRPWAFLAPDYIAAKPWYREFVRQHFTPAPPSGKGRVTASGRAAPAERVTTPVSFELPPFLRAAAAAAAASTDGAEEPATASASASVRAAGTEPFYIVPKGRYDFRHPVGAGKDHSHFKSMWYVWLGRRQTEVMRAATVALLARDGDGKGGAPAVVHGLQGLEENKLVLPTERRPNPQRRQQQQQQQGRGRRW